MTLIAELSDLIDKGHADQALTIADEVLASEPWDQLDPWIFQLRASAGLLCPRRYWIQHVSLDWTWARMRTVLGPDGTPKDINEEIRLDTQLDVAFQTELILRYVRDHDFSAVERELQDLAHMTYNVIAPNVDAFVLMTDARVAYAQRRYLNAFQLHRKAQMIWIQDIDRKDRELHLVATNNFHMLRALMMCPRTLWKSNNNRAELRDRVIHDSNIRRVRWSRIIASGRVGAHIERLLRR
jgi:hypothetical protein